MSHPTKKAQLASVSNMAIEGDRIATAAEPPTPRPRAFDGIKKNAKPCPICLSLARCGEIQERAVMPLPPFPARLKSDGSQCCRDCQATEAAMAIWRIHPSFGPARLTVANERCESLTMPLGMAEHFGMCRAGLVRPASLEDLDQHLVWLRRNKLEIPLEKADG